MKHEDLPERWKSKLKDHINREFGKNRQRLSATDFRHALKMNFADGSFLFFHYAFYILDREANEVGVFTEHCGYHIFPLNDTKLKLLETKWSENG